MTFIKKLLGKRETQPRVRVCWECGMPVDEHKDWCSIVAGRAKSPRPDSETAS